MKIILCICLLYITAVSVFGEPQELNGIVGESVKFPAAVKIDGKLMHSGVAIGDVISSRFTPPRDVEYSGRVQWDSSTGFFSLSGLRLKDSGIYTVQDTQQTSVSTFNLTVWEDTVPVSKPHLSVTHNEYRCTVLCAAVRGTGATLTLYKNGENPYVSSLVESAPHLHLPVPVDEGGIYTCEAKNSVSSEISDPLTVEAHCTAGPSTGTIAAIIITVVAVLIAVVFAVLYWLTRSRLKVTRSRLKVIRSELEGIRYEHTVTSSELKVTRSELEGIKNIHAGIISEDAVTRRELEVIRSELEELRGPAKGDEKPEKEKCAIS